MNHNKIISELFTERQENHDFRLLLSNISIEYLTFETVPFEWTPFYFIHTAFFTLVCVPQWEWSMKLDKPQCNESMEDGWAREEREKERLLLSLVTKTKGSAGWARKLTDEIMEYLFEPGDDEKAILIQPQVDKGYEYLYNVMKKVPTFK